MIATALHGQIRDDPRAPILAQLPIVSRVAALMGGQVGVHVEPRGNPDDHDQAVIDADRVLRRIAAWADRLTRFTDTSELACLNRDPRPEVPVGPTMAAVLDWARAAEGTSGGIVDIGLLDARLAAEAAESAATAMAGAASRARSGPASPASRAWSIDRPAGPSSAVRSGSGSISMASGRAGWPIGRSTGSGATAPPSSTPTGTWRSASTRAGPGRSASRTHGSTDTTSRSSG